MLELVEVHQVVQVHIVVHPTNGTLTFLIDVLAFLIFSGFSFVHLTKLASIALQKSKGTSTKCLMKE